MNDSIMKIAGEDALRQNIAETKQYIEEHSGVQSFNGRSGSVLPMAGDYSADQVNYDSNKTVKQVIDALATKEASDIAGQQSLVKDTVGWTGKNLLPYPYKDSARTHNGVTYVYNSDNTITANGTATSSSWRTLTEDFSFLELGKKYRLSGCPTGGNSSSYLIQLTYNDGTEKFLQDYGDGIEFTYTGDFIRLQVLVKKNYTANNLVFKPMIRKADITDPTYEPYHESVEVMYEEAIHGVNLLKNEAATQTVNGVTFTVNADGSITANGTATADSTCFIQGSGWNYNNTVENFLEQGETYILSDGVNSYTGDKNVPNIRMYGYTSTGTAWSKGEITPNTHNEFTVDTTMKACHISVYIRVPNGQTVSNLVFKPIIRKADIEDSTYRPYNEQAIQNQLNAQGVLGAKNLLNPTYAGGTINGVTITANDNKTYKLNGAPSSGNMAVAIYKGTFPAGRYILNGVPDFTTYGARLHIRETAGASQVDAIDTGKGIEFTIPSATTSYSVFMYLNSGYTANNLIIKPMLRLASDPDDTYQPYAMTNKELTEKVFEKRMLTSSDNLNNVTETGFYGITTQPSNSPVAYATLIVNKRSDGGISQLMQQSSSIYTRTYGGNPAAWTSWYKFTGTVVS